MAGRRATAVAVALLAILTSCGGGSDRTEPAASTTASTGPPTTATPTTAAPTTTTTRPAPAVKAQALVALRAAPSIAAAERALDSFGARYGIDVATSSTPGSNIASTKLGRGDLFALRQLGAEWIKEWSKYGRTWLAYAGVKRVAFVKNLSVLTQARRASLDAGRDRMLYDVLLGSDPKQYTRRVLHHEFFHLIVAKNFGSPYASMDPAWTTFNPARFAYGTGGSTCYTNPAACGSSDMHPRTAFVSDYATTAIEEDQAEIYAYVFVSSYRASLGTWIRTDGKLAKKVAALTRWIRSRAPQLTSLLAPLTS